MGRLPPWQAVPGTPFVVDKFGKGTVAMPCQHWFLSHFHADHYGGLTRSFKQGGFLPSSPDPSCSSWVDQIAKSPKCAAGMAASVVRFTNFHHLLAFIDLCFWQ